MIIVVLMIFFFIGILGYEMVEGLYQGDLPCIEHNDEECTDCMSLYSFYGEGILSVKACWDHERAAYQHGTYLNDCRNCSSALRMYEIIIYQALRPIFIMSLILSPYS